MTDEIYLKILKYGSYLALFLPLYIGQRFIYPFITPKSVLFRILIEILFGAWVLLVLTYPQYRPKKTLLFWTLSIFCAVLILTAFTGVNPNRSFWSTFERVGGVFSFLHFFALFVILSTVFKTRKDWFNFLGLAVFAQSLVSLYGVSQKLKLGFAVESGVTRLSGTIGNAAFLAGYLIFGLFLAIVLFTQTRWKTDSVGVRQNQLTAKGAQWLKIFYGASFILILAVIMLTATRGAIFALIGGAFLFVLLYLIFGPGRDLKKYLILGIIILVIFGGFILSQKESSWVKKNSVLSRLVNISLKDPNITPRLMVWQMAYQGFKENPILGVGLENFNVVFNKYFNPLLMQSASSETWFDRSHNIVFDVLNTSGILGLISYLAIFFAGFYILFKRMFERSPEGRKEDSLTAIILIVGLSVYFAQNLFVFDMMPSYLIFFSFLGFVNYLDTESRRYHTEERGKNNARKHKKIIQPGHPVLGLAAILILIFLIYQTNIKFLQAAYWDAQATKATSLKMAMNDIMNTYMKSLSYNYSAASRAETALRMANYLVGQTSSQSRDNQDLKEWLEITAAELEKVVSQNSKDVRPYLDLGRVYNRMTQFDSGYIAKARDILNKALILSPQRQQLYYELGGGLMIEGKYPEAIAILEKSFSFNEKTPESAWNLGLAYIANQEYKKGVGYFEKAIDNGFKYQTKNNLMLMIQVYNALGEYGRIISLYEDLIKLEPDNAQHHASLAAAYAKLGQYEKAREEALLAKRLSGGRDLPEVDKFLEGLK